jgi:adenylate cyclase
VQAALLEEAPGAGWSIQEAGELVLKGFQRKVAAWRVVSQS